MYLFQINPFLIAFFFNNRRKFFPRLLTFFLLGFFFITPFSELHSNSKPYLYSPYLLLDCKDSNQVYQSSCFRKIAAITRQIVRFGLFEDVRSPSHIYFVENQKRGFISFEEKRPYKSSKWRDTILERYQNVFSKTVDKSRRYVLISVAKSEELSNEPFYHQQEERLQKILEIYLNARGISYHFENHKNFNYLYQKKFSNEAALVSIHIPKSARMKNLQTNFYQMKLALESLEGVVSSFSALDVWNEIQVLWGKSSWQELVNLREFVDGNRSQYWQPQEKTFSIVLYQKANSNFPSAKEIEKTVQKYFHESDFFIEVEIHKNKKHSKPVKDETILSMLSR